MGVLPEIVSPSVSVESDRTSDGTRVQTVVVELPSGETIRARPGEHFLLVNELPGVERELSLLAYPTAGTTRQEVETPRVSRPEVYRTQYSADCYGIIEAVSVDAIPRADVEFHVLDVGVGSLYVHPSVREYLSSSTLQPGDELFVPASHLLLWECHP
jgi:hypothetical protein